MYDSIFKTAKQTSILLLVVEIAIYYFVLSNDSNMSNSFLKKSVKINLLPPLFFFLILKELIISDIFSFIMKKYIIKLYPEITSWLNKMLSVALLSYL